MSYFGYGDKEINYLKSKDKKLAEVIERIGHIDRVCMDDLFEAVIHSIIGQQISTKAHESIWKRIKDDMGTLDAPKLLELGEEKLQAYGMTWRKVGYIMEFAEKVNSGTFELDAVNSMTDEEAIAALSSLKGVGVWTAEMILLFCLQRQDIFSFGDLAILRGIRMVYHHKDIPRERFERYRKRFSPYCSVASLYFWAVAGGAIPEMKDYKERGKNAIYE
ncbi:MAG: DNA-3-methyladenine glycosylase 2 family protein [Bacteroidales bacterium]|nr:DNA-3-methyladenine glycosylase 2 family protein [Clostridium sp.]MCM1205029.1 DNA-3-methyladenine glycosylase 2 family protein [Bacteroidales bacterium]